MDNEKIDVSMLADVMSCRVLEEDEIIELVINICSFAEKNRVHADIMPANIAMDGSILEIKCDNDNIYASPETVSDGKRDTLSDIYSIGVLIYTLVNGNRIPFSDLSGGNREKAVAMRLSGKELVVPENCRIELAGVIFSACANEREYRYQSITELKNALYNYKSKKQYMKKSLPSVKKKAAVKKDKPADIPEIIEEKIKRTAPENDKQREEYYLEARSRMINAFEESDYDDAIELFELLCGYRDSLKLIDICKKRRADMVVKHEAENVDWNEKFVQGKKDKRKDWISMTAVLVVIIIGLIILFSSGGETPTL